MTLEVGATYRSVASDKEYTVLAAEPDDLDCVPVRRNEDGIYTAVSAGLLVRVIPTPADKLIIFLDHGNPSEIESMQSVADPLAFAARCNPPARVAVFSFVRWADEEDAS